LLIRVLSVVDAFSRQCVALEADTSFASRRVTRVLEKAMNEYGWPKRIRYDHGLNASPFFIPVAHRCESLRQGSVLDNSRSRTN
jgi:transposase InsO family protein